MSETMSILGAVCALVIYISSILTFLLRLVGKPEAGKIAGIPLLLTFFPLAYLLVTARVFGRSPLYTLQVGLMLAWILALFLLDYVYKVDFRQSRWKVIAFVVLYFAGLGGMIGVAGLAGRAWLIFATILFLAAGALSFIQRRLTGI